MPQPSHIYASTQRRRGRRWSRRRPVWPAAVASIGVLAAVAIELIRGV